jgi:cytochrome oxidase assembly protein ShyY1
VSDDSRNFRFDPEWRLTLFTLVLVPLMTALGFWQLARAEEKAALAEAFESRQKQPPTPLSSAQERAPEALAYLPVELAGHFREGEYFLLDNRTQGGRFGNEVLGVFELSGSDELVLVNRGWVPADPARLQSPEGPPVPGRSSRGARRRARERRGPCEHRCRGGSAAGRSSGIPARSSS